MEPKDEGVFIGPHHHIEPGCHVGYRASRSLVEHTVRIGPDCHLRTGTIIYTGTTIGAGFQTGHNVVIREECVIGDGVSVWSGTVVDYGCRLGNGVRIHTNCYICQFTTIEDEVFLAPGVSLANDVYPLQEEAAPFMQGPTIKRGARIGVNVTLLPRVIIGEGALVGAGSVVTKNVAPGMVVAGNPARVINSVDKLMPIQQRVALQQPGV